MNKTIIKMCLAVLLLPAARAAAETEWKGDIITGTNMVRQVLPTGTNYFMGKVGIGTNVPGSQLYVAGDMTVTGPMKVPKQGDVSMGSYTNGASTGGVTGGGGGGTSGGSGVLTNQIMSANGTIYTITNNPSSGRDVLYFDSQTTNAWFAKECVLFVKMSNNVDDIDGATLWKIQFDDVYVDSYGTFSNYQYRLPVPGLYSISAESSSFLGNEKVLALQVYVISGSTTNMISDSEVAGSGAGQLWSIGTPDILYKCTNTSDQVFVYFFNNASAKVTCLGEWYTYLSVRYVGKIP